MLNQKISQLILFLGILSGFSNFTGCAKFGYIDYYSEKDRIKKEINKNYSDYLLKNQLSKETLDTLLLGNEIVLDLDIDIFNNGKLYQQNYGVFSDKKEKLFNNFETKNILKKINPKIPIIIIDKKTVNTPELWQTILHERAHQYFVEKNIAKKGKNTFFKFYEFFKDTLYGADIDKAINDNYIGKNTLEYIQRLEMNSNIAKDNYSEFFAYLIAGQLGPETYQVLKQDYSAVYKEFRKIQADLTPLTEEKREDSFIYP